MGRSLLGALLVAGLVIAATADRGATEPAYVARTELPASFSQSSDLITHVTTQEGQPPMITVIDPRQRVMGIYLVDRGTGKIMLKSVRNFTWDLQMTNYDCDDPQPQDIRSGLQH